MSSIALDELNKLVDPSFEYARFSVHISAAEVNAHIPIHQAIVFGFDADKLKLFEQRQFDECDGIWVLDPWLNEIATVSEFIERFEKRIRTFQEINVVIQCLQEAPAYKSLSWETLNKTTKSTLPVEKPDISSDKYQILITSCSNSAMAEEAGINLNKKVMSKRPAEAQGLIPLGRVTEAEYERLLRGEPLDPSTFSDIFEAAARYAGGAGAGGAWAGAGGAGAEPENLVLSFMPLPPKVLEEMGVGPFYTHHFATPDEDGAASPDSP